MTQPHGASPEGGSTGLERTQDQLEIALREGDESSSGGRLPSSQEGSDDLGGTPLEGAIPLTDKLRDAKNWLNGGKCCGQVDSAGICFAPACIFGEACKWMHEAADEIDRQTELRHAVEAQGSITLTADFARALPGGKLDDSEYEAIESALDRADAPCQAENGRWLMLAERVAALRAAAASPESLGVSQDELIPTPASKSADLDAEPSAAFTPGPWVVWSSIYEGMVAQVRSTDMHERPIAEVRKHPNGYRDALLMAAGPNLLEALRRVDRWINTSLPVGTESATFMLGVVREAIAKAEGRS